MLGFYFIIIGITISSLALALLIGYFYVKVLNILCERFIRNKSQADRFQNFR